MPNVYTQTDNKKKLSDKQSKILEDGRLKRQLNICKNKEQQFRIIINPKPVKFN